MPQGKIFPDSHDGPKNVSLNSLFTVVGDRFSSFWSYLTDHCIGGIIAFSFTRSRTTKIINCKENSYIYFRRCKWENFSESLASNFQTDLPQQQTYLLQMRLLKPAKEHIPCLGL